MTRRWNCCRCCQGIALSDHVAHGGSIETDMHEGSCDTCRQRYDDDSREVADDNGNAR